MDVANPSVIDASTFDPTADGQTLSLSAETNAFIAYQSVALYSGLISEELWTGQVRQQVVRLSARTFTGSDDINARFFAPLSLAIASNANAITALQGGPQAASDVNLARASMNLGFSLELMAETMCSGVIQGGPDLTDAQLLDSAITRFTQAVTVGTAAGAAGTDIVNASNVGLARAYLQKGDFANASKTAALVPASFVMNIATSANASTKDELGNQIFGYTDINDAVAPVLYRMGDLRVPVDSTKPGKTENGTPLVIPAKYTSYGDPVRLASGLEAQYIAAEAALHSSGDTGPAMALIADRRTAGGQGAYNGGSDTLSVITELLNQRARDFWLEGKKLGDIRRNPSVPLASVLMDPAGAMFYANSKLQFGTTLCAPIPPQETSANPNFPKS
jgi:hypothetical protein